MKNNIILILKGMGMGIANVIPGVSGGTVALITGIYTDLLNPKWQWPLCCATVSNQFLNKSFQNTFLQNLHTFPRPQWLCPVLAPVCF